MELISRFDGDWRTVAVKLVLVVRDDTDESNVREKDMARSVGEPHVIMRETRRLSV